MQSQAILGPSGPPLIKCEDLIYPCRFHCLGRLTAGQNDDAHGHASQRAGDAAMVKALHIPEAGHSGTCNADQDIVEDLPGRNPGHSNSSSRSMI
eukprot:scaffold92313_cov20-Tisochrysis_lutea.AAC.2